MSSPEHAATDLASVASGADYAPDRRRMHLLWLAMALIGFLGLAVVLLAGYGAEVMPTDYTDSFLLIGLLALLTCAVAYFADKERAYRAENRSLIQQLHDTARALDARVARLNQLCETSTHLAGNLDVGKISELVVDALVKQVRADGASLVLLDKSKGEYRHTASKAPLAQAESERHHPAAVARAAAAEGAPAIHWLEDLPEVAEQLRAWDRVRATISAPLNVSEVMGGALAAIRQESFDTEDLNLLTTLANMASKAIESAELHEELRQSYFRTLHVLARSLAARDPYSAAHGEAVTWLACHLAERLGLDQNAIEALQAYGLLHDLGKIGIPDAVLLKPGALSQEELEMCRQHAALGEEIIRPLNPGPAVLAMMRSHHERWDGAGYPDRLGGEQIPILARVVAVADAFHAIVSHRSYRGGAIPFRALQEIKELAGTQFDPAIVAALVSLWEAGELAKFVMRLGESEQPHGILDLPALAAAPRPVFD